MDVVAGGRMNKKMKNRITVIAWTVLISLVTIRTVWKPYPIPGQRPLYWVPSFDEWDYLLFIVGSIVAGLMLVDLETVFFGWIKAVTLSSLITVIYLSFHFWFIEEMYKVFSQDPFGWEYSIYFAILRVFELMFPLNIVLIFICVFLGGFLSEAVGLSKKIASAFPEEVRE